MNEKQSKFSYEEIYFSVFFIKKPIKKCISFCKSCFTFERVSIFLQPQESSFGWRTCISVFWRHFYSGKNYLRAVHLQSWTRNVPCYSWSKGQFPCCHDDCEYSSDGSGSKIFDPGQVESIFCGLGQVGLTIYGLGLNLENFP